MLSSSGVVLPEDVFLRIVELLDVQTIFLLSMVRRLFSVISYLPKSTSHLIAIYRQYLFPLDMQNGVSAHPER